MNSWLANAHVPERRAEMRAGRATPSPEMQEMAAIFSSVVCVVMPSRRSPSITKEKLGSAWTEERLNDFHWSSETPENPQVLPDLNFRLFIDRVVLPFY